MVGAAFAFVFLALYASLHPFTRCGHSHCSAFAPGLMRRSIESANRFWLMIRDQCETANPRKPGRSACL